MKVQEEGMAPSPSHSTVMAYSANAMRSGKVTISTELSPGILACRYW